MYPFWADDAILYRQHGREGLILSMRALVDRQRIYLVADEMYVLCVTELQQLFERSVSVATP